MKILVAVPVLGRPHRAAPLVESLAESTNVPCRLLFLCSPGDDEQIEACLETGADVDVVPWECGPGDYARKINRACELAERETWVFQAADDLCFCPSWAEYALQAAERRSIAHVIGTNDLGNARVVAGRHATHSLVKLEYIRHLGTADESGKMLHEGYDHQFCDDELVGTAQSRGAFLFVTEAEVPHLHPHWKKAPMDATYEKGQAGFAQDSRLFQRRRPLWERRGVTLSRR